MFSRKKKGVAVAAPLLIGSFVLGIAVVSGGCGGGNASVGNAPALGVPTPSPSSGPSATPTPTPTPSASPTASPTPTPTVSPTASPTPTPTPSPTTVGGNVTFSSVASGGNATTSALGTPYVYSTIHTQNERGMESLIQPSKTDNSRLVYVGIVNESGTLAAGRSYPAFSSTNQVNYEEHATNGTVRKWSATGGTVIVDRIDAGEIVTYRIVGATMAPNTTQSGGATGTFTIDGTATTTEVGGAGG